MNNCGFEELPPAYPTPRVHLCVPLPHPDKQIRVLDLDAVRSSDLNETPALYCHFRIISLSSYSEEFTALSYVWAQQDPGVSQRANRLIISCGNHQHDIRLGPNCWSALWHLSKTRGHLKIWVDALCIEQGNDEEKAEQIALMRTIYASAHTTYFWLGEAGKGTDEAMHYLSSSRVLVSSGRFGDMLWAALELFKRCLTRELFPHQFALDEIFDRPWVKRLWTLQECLLAKKGVVICGEKSIHWPDLICALESMQYFRTMSNFLYFRDSYDPWLNLAQLSRSGTFTADPDLLGEQQQLDEASRNRGALDHRVQRHLGCLDWAHVTGLYAPAFTTLFMGLFLYVLVDPFESIWRGMFAHMLMSIVVMESFGALREIHRIKFRHSFCKAQHPIVQELRTRKATEPRDMYYGIAGILSDEPPTTKGSLCDQYRALCSNLIEKTKSLDMLLIANSHPEDKFPSWVINWNSATPRIWDKAPFYFSSTETQQRVNKYRSLLPRLSKLWTHLYDRVFSPRETEYESNCIVNDPVGFGFLHMYQGVAQDSTPLWEFRNHGQDLCVRGLLLTHVSSHNVALYTEIGADDLKFAAQALALARKQNNNFSSDTDSGCGLISGHLIRTTGSQATTLILDELRIITAFARSTFSGMTGAERVGIEKGFERLREVVPGEMEVESRTARWWLKLRLGMRYIWGKREEKCLFAAQNLISNNQEAVLDFLREEGLIMVRIEATASCSGGLGFASAAARKGDAVALVSGVSLPLVLRRCGQRGFRLIGPLFLPGVLNGELKDMLTSETLDDITLV